MLASPNMSLDLLSFIVNLILHWLIVIETSLKQKCVCVMRHIPKLKHDAHAVLPYCVRE